MHVQGLFVQGSLPILGHYCSGTQRHAVFTN
jgi:hypothetical protein